MTTHLSPTRDISLDEAIAWLASHRTPTLWPPKSRKSPEFLEFRRLVRLSSKQVGEYEPFPAEDALSSDLRLRAFALQVIQRTASSPPANPFPHRRALWIAAEKFGEKLRQRAEARSEAWRLTLEAWTAGDLAIRARKAGQRRFIVISEVSGWNLVWPPPQALEWEKVILDRVEFQRWASRVVRTPRGRIPRFAWSDFRTVASEKLCNNQHWTKTMLNTEMAKWCATNWRRQPASIMITQQIAKVFAEFAAAARK